MTAGFPSEGKLRVLAPIATRATDQAQSKQGKTIRFIVAWKPKRVRLVDGNLLRLLSELPFLDRLEMVDVSGRCGGAVYEAVPRLKSGHLAKRHVSEHALLRHQFVEATLLDHPAPLQYVDPVRPFDGGQAMGAHYARY